tara:strand:+ start:2831 stop:3445 length:615 start_codon:yes stop_codon:yes gene_type:complete
METIKKRKMKRKVMTTEKGVNNGVFLYNDVPKYNLAMSVEDRCINAIEKLTLVSEASIGKGSIKDYEAFLKSPLEYLIEGYWDKYGQKYNAPNSNRMRVFLTSTGIKAMDVEFYAKQYNESSKVLGSDLSPVLEGNKYNRVVSKENFDVYVSESKSEAYQATVNLIEAVNKFKEVMPVAEMFHLARFTKNAVKYTGEVEALKFR